MGSFLLVPIVVIVISLFMFLLLANYLEYKPKDNEKLLIHNPLRDKIDSRTNYKILTWNVGYFGLGHEADFFADGGKGVKPTKKIMNIHLNNILEQVKKVSPDYIFFQEVDTKSARTYFFDQYSYLYENLREYYSSFAYNFKVFYVPFPILRNLGHVESGIAAFSRFKINEANRISLPNENSGIKRFFNLKRCISENIVLVNNKELLLINVHLSAFDKNGKIRAKQQEFIKDYLLKLNKNYKYIIVGGDWNSQMKNIDLSNYNMKESKPDWLYEMEGILDLENWNWAYSKNIPTCRSTKTKYIVDYNFLTIIDGFLCSPNIKINSVKTLDLQFKDSDHNPVLLDFSLQ